MAHINAIDVVVLVTTAASVIGVSVGLLRILFSFDLCSKVRALWQFFVKGPLSHDAEMMAIVKERWSQLKLVHFKIIWTCLACLLAYGAVRRCFDLMDDDVELRDDPEDKEHAQDLGISVLALATAVPVAWPNILTPKLTVLYDVVLTLTLAFGTSPMNLERAQRGHLIAGADFIVLVVTLSRQSAENVLNILANLIFAVTTSISLAYSGRSGIAGFQFVGIASLNVVAVGLERGGISSLCQALQYQESKELYYAACALLRSCCDVVVELDSEGRIVTPTVELSSFLLMQPRERPQGLRLADLIADEEERRQFVEKLEKPRLEEMGLAENMQVSIKDSWHNLLRLELLWFQFRRRFGTPHYMVGLREFSDQPLPGTSSEVLGDEALGRLPERASVISGSLEDPPPVAVVEIAEGFPIRSLTSEFCIRIGRLTVGAHIVQYVTRPAKFNEWLQEAVNYAVHDLEPPPHTVTFRMPQGDMKALCKVSVKGSQLVNCENQTAPNSESAEDRLHIQFLHIRKEELRDSERSQRRSYCFVGTPSSPVKRLSM